MLKLGEVNTYYDDIQALFNVSLEVDEGDIVTIVGSNGAGKSTLLNTISGVVSCGSGSIEFLGKRMENLPAHDIVELGIVQIPEGRRIFPRMTVLENLDLGAFSRHARAGRDGNVETVFNLFPVLQERRFQIAGTLSGGEQQMLAIARALMSVPKLLMFDEPSLGLAPKMIASVFEIAKEINRRGITVCLVEQNVFHSLSIAKKGYVLENGRIVLTGNGKELLANDHVKQAYLGL